MNKTALLSGATLGLLTVAIGAFGAHALKPVLIEFGRLETFETAVKYQAYHALALLIVGFHADKLQEKWGRYAVRFFIVGALIFSGSLYFLSTLNLPILGAITPIGGVMLILGWASLLMAISKMK